MIEWKRKQVDRERRLEQIGRDLDALALEIGEDNICNYPTFLRMAAAAVRNRDFTTARATVSGLLLEWRRQIAAWLEQS